MRTLPLFLLPLAFPACSEREKPISPSAQVREISYSTEVRPFLINNCLSCHADLPLHNPSGWDLFHPHETPHDFSLPDFLQTWIEQGSRLDPHWAGLPVHEVAGDSVDDFIDQEFAILATKRQPLGPIFTAPVIDLLAGDLLEDESKTISTGYFRQGDDTPEWRVQKVAREFLGISIACAKCHDHPSENWTTARYQQLLEIFTTPYDALPDALPPLYIKQSSEQAQKRDQLQIAIAQSVIPAPTGEEAFQQWLTQEGSAPQLPGLVAAYSFDDRELTNSAPLDVIEEDGNRLIAENGAHGAGIYFDGQNELVLSGVPTGTERDRFTFSAWIKVAPTSPADLPILTIGERARGFELRIIEGKLQARWTRVWPQQAITTTSEKRVIIPDRWTHLAVTYDGSRHAAGLKLYLNGHPLETDEAPGELFASVLSNRVPWRFSAEGLTLDEVQIYSENLTLLGIRHLFDGRSLAIAQPADLRPIYQRHFDPGEANRRAEVSSLISELLAIEDSLKVFLVMAEPPNRPLPTDPQAPRNRLDFAQRLNPDLLARSLANEVWRRHFGTPLAHSLGFSDPLPSHPELLEWLAGQLKRDSFNVARLGEIIRASTAWRREWPALPSGPASCPITR